jgi:hypothetical protein
VVQSGRRKGVCIEHGKGVWETRDISRMVPSNEGLGFTMEQHSFSVPDWKATYVFTVLKQCRVK